MAISPKDLEANLEEEALLFESFIDKCLHNQKLYRGGSVNVSTPEGMSNAHFAVLEKKYLAAGWSKITWTDDQSGSYLVFKY